MMAFLLTFIADFSNRFWLDCCKPILKFLMPGDFQKRKLRSNRVTLLIYSGNLYNLVTNVFQMFIICTYIVVICADIGVRIVSSSLKFLCNCSVELVYFTFRFHHICGRYLGTHILLYIKYYGS